MLFYLYYKLNLKLKREGFSLKDYICTVRGYIYEVKNGDPDNGIKAGTAFKDIPSDWECPDCGSYKDDFEELEEEL